MSRYIMSNREEAVSLRLRGLKYREISEILGISKQRVHQIVKNYNSFSGSGLSYKNFPNISILYCECCHDRERRTQIHHKDKDCNNNSPDNLMRLCSECHGEIHRKSS